MITDSVMYGRPTLAALNIAAYNVIGPHVWDDKHVGGGDAQAGGSHLYGTEPWWFYLANCAINHNVVLLLFLCLPVCAFARSKVDVGNAERHKQGLESKGGTKSDKPQDSLHTVSPSVRQALWHELGCALFPAYLWFAFRKLSM